MYSFFTVFFKTLGFLLAVLLVIMIIIGLSNFSNNENNQQFSLIEGNDKSNNSIFILQIDGPIIENDSSLNDLVGFRPSSEYEFIVDNERLYRVLSNFITIKYEYQGDEETYNPSWAQSS